MTINVPNFLQQNGVGQLLPLNLCKIRCSNTDIKVAAGDNSLQARVQNGVSGSSKTGFIFLFQDDFLTKLLGVCKVEVHSLTYINFAVRSGEEYDYTLKVLNSPNADGETPVRTIELFCSDPSLIYPPGGKKRNVQVLKDIKKFSQGFPMIIKSDVMGVTRARVHCVDINTRKVVQAYLFDIQADKPKIDKTVPLSSFVGKEKLFKFNFLSPATSALTTFSLSSNSPQLLRPVNQYEKVQPKQNKELEVVVPAQAVPGMFEAIVHINRV